MPYWLTEQSGQYRQGVLVAGWHLQRGRQQAKAGRLGIVKK